MDFSGDTLGKLVTIAPLTYLVLLTYCIYLALLRPGETKPSLGALSVNNLGFWGYAGGIIVFLILLGFHRIGTIQINPIDYFGVRLTLWAFGGLFAGVILLEGARFKNLQIFLALFILLVVAGSLSSFYVFVVFEEIRAILSPSDIAEAFDIPVSEAIDVINKFPLENEIWPFA